MHMAMRIGMDPFMFLQRTYVTSGKLGLEGQLAIALVNTRGKIRGKLKFEYTGKEGTNERACVAWAVDQETGEVVRGPKVSIQTAVDEGWYGRNPKWKTIPELMLAYRAGAWFARVNCPDALLGMELDDELVDTGRDRPVQAAGTGAAKLNGIVATVEVKKAETTEKEEPVKKTKKRDIMESDPELQRIKERALAEEMAANQTQAVDQPNI